MEHMPRAGKYTSKETVQPEEGRNEGEARVRQRQEGGKREEAKLCVQGKIAVSIALVAHHADAIKRAISSSRHGTKRRGREEGNKGHTKLG